jgi:hypothetical protein
MIFAGRQTRENLILRRRVDEDVKRRQLTVLRYTNVSASKPLRVIVRSIRPREATDAVHRLSRPTDREPLRAANYSVRNRRLLFEGLMC